MLWTCRKMRREAQLKLLLRLSRKEQASLQSALLLPLQRYRPVRYLIPTGKCKRWHRRSVTATDLAQFSTVHSVRKMRLVVHGEANNVQMRSMLPMDSRSRVHWLRIKMRYKDRYQRTTNLCSLRQMVEHQPAARCRYLVQPDKSPLRIIRNAFLSRRIRELAPAMERRLGQIQAVHQIVERDMCTKRQIQEDRSACQYPLRLQRLEYAAAESTETVMETVF